MIATYEHARASQSRRRFAPAREGIRGLVGEHPQLLHRGAQRDAPRHVAVAQRGLRDDAGGDPDVDVLRGLPLGLDVAFDRIVHWIFRRFGA